MVDEPVPAKAGDDGVSARVCRDDRGCDLECWPAI